MSEDKIMITRQMLDRFISIEQAYYILQKNIENKKELINNEDNLDLPSLNKSLNLLLDDLTKRLVDAQLYTANNNKATLSVMKKAINDIIEELNTHYYNMNLTAEEAHESAFNIVIKDIKTKIGQQIINTVYKWNADNCINLVPEIIEYLHLEGYKVTQIKESNCNYLKIEW